MMSDVDLDALAEAACSATRGPWEATRCRQGSTLLSAVTAPSVPTNDGTLVAVTDNVLPEDARYIAAASPDVLLALIERVRVAEAAVVRVREREQFYHWGGDDPDRYRQGFAAGLAEAVSALTTPTPDEGSTS